MNQFHILLSQEYAHFLILLSIQQMPQLFQSQIESEWHVDFGDRKIELVFIGQNLDVKSITKVLENSLLTEKELVDWGNGDFSQHDNWPIKNH